MVNNKLDSFLTQTCSIITVHATQNGSTMIRDKVSALKPWKISQEEPKYTIPMEEKVMPLSS